jgi:hypothetical protein
MFAFIIVITAFMACYYRSHPIPGDVPSVMIDSAGGHEKKPPWAVRYKYFLMALIDAAGSLVAAAFFGGYAQTLTSPSASSTFFAEITAILEIAGAGLIGASLLIAVHVAYRDQERYGT